MMSKGKIYGILAIVIALVGGFGIGSYYDNLQHSGVHFQQEMFAYFNNNFSHIAIVNTTWDCPNISTVSMYFTEPKILGVDWSSKGQIQNTTAIGINGLRCNVLTAKNYTIIQQQQVKQNLTKTVK